MAKKQINVAVDSEVVRRAKVSAVDMSVTFQSLVEMALLQLLSRPVNERRKLIEASAKRKTIGRKSTI